MAVTQSVPQTTASSRGSRNKVVAVVVVVVIAVILVAALELYPTVSPSRVTAPPPASVTLTAANLQIAYPGGASSGYLGPSSQSLDVKGLPLNLTGGQQFTLTVTLNSQASTVGSHTVSAITTDTTGFGVDSVSPSLPYTLGPGASVAFTITLTAPSTGYDGTYTVVVTTS